MKLEDKHAAHERGRKSMRAHLKAIKSFIEEMPEEERTIWWAGLITEACDAAKVSVGDPDSPKIRKRLKFTVVK